MKNKIKLLLILVTLNAPVIYFGAEVKHTKPIAVNVPYFKTGQILLPDYACSDTLIVTNADGLNKAIGLFEQGIIDGSDSDYDSVFHQYCKIK